MSVTPKTQDLDRIIKAAVRTATGLATANVIDGDDPAPAPNSLYATVLMMNSRQRGIDSHRYEDGSDPEKVNIAIAGCRETPYSVQFFRAGAMDAARLFLAWPQTPLGQFFMQQNNVSLKILSDIRRIDSVISDSYEERASMDIEVSFTEHSTQEVNAVASIGLDLSASAEIDYNYTEEVTSI